MSCNVGESREEGTWSAGGLRNGEVKPKAGLVQCRKGLDPVGPPGRDCTGRRDRASKMRSSRRDVEARLRAMELGL